MPVDLSKIDEYKAAIRTAIEQEYVFVMSGRTSANIVFTNGTDLDIKRSAYFGLLAYAGYLKEESRLPVSLKTGDESHIMRDAYAKFVEALRKEGLNVGEEIVGNSHPQKLPQSAVFSR